MVYHLLSLLRSQANTLIFKKSLGERALPPLAGCLDTMETACVQLQPSFLRREKKKCAKIMELIFVSLKVKRCFGSFLVMNLLSVPRITSRKALIRTHSSFWSLFPRTPPSKYFPLFSLCCLKEHSLGPVAFLTWVAREAVYMGMWMYNPLLTITWIHLLLSSSTPTVSDQLPPSPIWTIATASCLASLLLRVPF